MIQMIIFLSLALSSGVFAEVCRDPATNYTSFAGDLPDGQEPAQLCQCMQASYEKSGELKGKTFECVESEALDTLKWADAKDDGTQPICKNCLGGCRRVATTNPTDSEKLCEIITQSEVRQKRGLRWYCYLVIVIKWFKIKIYWYCRWVFF